MLKITAHVALSNPGDVATIEADLPEELHRALTYLASIGALRGGSAPRVPESLDVTNPDQWSPGPEPQDTEEPKDEGREPEPEAKPTKPKAEKPTKPKAEKPKKDDGPKVKAEDVTAAVTELANATNLETARALLSDFGVKRAAELKPEQYASFVEACKTGLANAAANDADQDDGVL